LGSMSVSAIGVTVLLRIASEGATPERGGVPLLAVTRGDASKGAVPCQGR